MLSLIGTTVTLLLYTGSTALLACALSAFRQVSRLPAVGCALLALLAHAGTLLWMLSQAEPGWSLSPAHVLSLLFWLLTLLLTAGLHLPLVRNLALLLYPSAALSLLPVLLFNGTEGELARQLPVGVQLHLSLSVLAMGLLALAALQVLLISAQDRWLHARHPVWIMQFLPPLQMMERYLFQIITLGFFMLSMSLVSGLMFPGELLNPQLLHKAALSALAWLIFGILLWGRWTQGWRGRWVVRWTLGGCAILIAAYFGSKVVLG